MLVEETKYYLSLLNVSSSTLKIRVSSTTENLYTELLPLT